MLQLVYLVSLLAVILVCQFYGFPRVHDTASDWVSDTISDPRVAVTAMMYLLADANGPVTAEKEEQIVSLLQSKVGLEHDLARKCLDTSRKVTSYMRGDLNSRLHTLITPIGRNCTRQEKRDAVEMLEAVAGGGALSSGPVRDSLSRVSLILQA
jgi:hypothetical protein